MSKVDFFLAEGFSKMALIVGVAGFFDATIGATPSPEAEAHIIIDAEAMGIAVIRTSGFELAAEVIDIRALDTVGLSNTLCLAFFGGFANDGLVLYSDLDRGTDALDLVAFGIQVIRVVFIDVVNAPGPRSVVFCIANFSTFSNEARLRILPLDWTT